MAGSIFFAPKFHLPNQLEYNYGICMTKHTENKETANKHSQDHLKAEIGRITNDLKESNSKLETIYNASSESIWVCDGKGFVLSVNKATEKLLGICAPDVTGRNINDLVKDGLMDQSVTQQVLDSKRQVSIIQNALKTNKQLLVTGTPVFDDDNNISMVIVNERDLTQLNLLENQLQQVRKESTRIKEELSKLNLKELESQSIIAHSKEMQTVLKTGQKLADMNISNILILGESGTGKGLLTKYIHTINKKSSGPFVTINCAALPENLLEAELFGYEKGAFTGARDQGKIGLFEMAQDGTLFLDEIGELPLSLQAKLLHCLEEKEIMHLGGLKPIQINCRVIAATNRDLENQVQVKKFRNDLYFRLNTFPITIPPLRERREDILELSLFFLKKYNTEYGLSRSISSMALKRLQSYSFPGNIRELKNSIKKSMIMAEKDILDSIIDYGFPGTAGKSGKSDKADKNPDLFLATREEGFNETIAKIEKKILSKALKKHKSTRSLASYLKMSQSQVVRKLTKHNLNNRLKRKLSK
jgi:PAS domain S-box-containing protein